ncbi:WbqC-like protein family protein [Chryseobacterium arachidis]|uniref:WbqC-like protein family protein n=1 Tax=Chryseobacterium arachidis TaxID=1416778 RepID=A0A1M4XFZ4_9FLAO|nr:WbqC family protein [Chryseobacterium arachidis]SHE92263.1 WbqC-like protein family protein [Chryseobacterium arachidis]
MNKILILQSNYIPWKGYFDLINASDVFVVYDDMQYTKGDWRNRNMIKTDKGLKWLTIPVEKISLHQKINETKVVSNKWNLAHWETLKQNYKGAKCFAEVKDFVQSLYVNATQEYLTDVNIYFLDKLCDFLDIDFNIRSSKEFNLVEDRTQRLVDICKNLNGNEYISGPAARVYMNEDLFKEADINVHFFDYSGYPEYAQLHSPFEHGVTILDLIFNEGANAKNFLKTKSLQK